jgi:hypothetical protein
MQNTCVIQEIQKKYNINLESGIIELTFDYYNYENLLRQKFEKYNLFELIVLLNISRLKSDLNKKAIIDTLINNKLDIEYYDNNYHHTGEDEDEDDKDMFRVQGNSIKWKLQKLRRQDYNIVIVDNDNKYIMAIQIDDIIKIADKEYSIYMSLYRYICVCDDDKGNSVCVILNDIETEEEKEYTAQEFIDIFKNEDVTYVKSMLLDWLYGNN